MIASLSLRRTANRAAAAAALLATVLCGSALAQGVDDLPPALEGVGVDEKLGDQVPLDLKFRNTKGEWITLGELFSQDRPVLLTLNYSSCPMLCREQLNGLVRDLKLLKLTAGDDFHVVSVSIDPLEMPEKAKATKEKYTKLYGRTGAAHGWHFLVGDEENIQALADAVGFRYKYLPDRQEYSHTAAVMLCSPNGVVTRYLYGVRFEETTLRMSIVEASEGTVGTPMDQVFLFCFAYDHTEGRYGPMAQRIMSIGGGMFVAALAVALLPYWLRRHPPAAASDASGEGAAGVAAPIDKPATPETSATP
ncbi:MAG: SCO family protein [Planctomycetota bacterium]